MEHLFMQVFERRDWVATQVQQQADSYAQTLACTLLAAGHQPPDWLLPFRVGRQQKELNGKLIVPELFFPRSQITTPAANRNVFFTPAIPSSSIRNPEIPNAYTQPVNNFAALSTLVDDQHEETQEQQISLSKELENTCAEAKMFSRIQRSKSRQRNIEDSRRGRDQAANCGSCDGIQAAQSNKTTVSSSLKSCGDVANNAEITSCPDQANGFYAGQGRSTESLKCNNNLGTQGNQLDCLSSPDLEDKVMSTDNKRSARDLQVVPLPEHFELNIADNICHTMAETNLVVEPKKLLFDGAEQVCMDTTSEQRGQQQDSALESDHFSVADRGLLSEDPYPGSSSQELHSMDRSSHCLKSDYLKHNQYGSGSSHRDLNANSLNEEPSLQFSSEVPSFVGDSLHQNSILYVTETISKLSQTQETRPLNSDETKCSERSHFVVNPLIEKDTLQTVEDTKKLESSNTMISPPSSGPLQQPMQQADVRFEANASGMSANSLLGENEHDHLSNLLTNGTNRRCSRSVSSVSAVQLPPQPFTSSPLSCGTHSNGFSTVDAFESAENMLPLDQYLLSKPSFEFDGSVADADASLGRPPDMHNKMLIGTASELVNCHSGELGADVHVNKKDHLSSVSSGGTRKMHKTERSSAFPSEKCNGSLRPEGIEQEIPPVDNDVSINSETCTVENVELMKSSRSSVQYNLRSSVSYEKNNQLQADSGNARKRPVADAVQVNGGTSSRTKRIKCQDVTHPHSSLTKSLSLSNQDGIGSHAVTAEKLSGRSRPSGRYLLRSSGFKEFMSLESKTKNAANNNKISAVSVMENMDISPKRIKNYHLSNVDICNSSSGVALLPSFRHSNDSSSAVEGMDFRNSEAKFQTNSDTVATPALPSCFAPDNVECCAQEENLCLEGLGLSVNISNVKCQEMAIQMDENAVLVNQENYSGTDSVTLLPSHVLDEHDKQTSDLVASLHKKLSFNSGVKLDSRCESEDPVRLLLSDATIPRQEGDESIDCDNILPEFERFDVSLPLDSPTTEKRTYEALSDPRRFGSFSLDVSSKYKVNTVSGMHQLMAAMSEKATNCSFSADLRHYSMSSDNITDIFGSYGLGFSGSFLPSDIVASCSSNGSGRHVSGENPLTPAVEKYSLGQLSGRVGSVSEHIGSMPELSCFRIDEDSGTAEENECQDMLPESVANQVQSGRKALQDITGLCQKTQSSALNSLGFMDASNTEITTETCSSKLNQNSGLKNVHNNKKSKESDASFVKREGKVSHPLTRLSKTEVNTSEANLAKRSKPSNIVGNVASFIPLVKAKQPATCVKKDVVRVKALEAAEAAKRLEEKKQNEREMRKAAAKLEREKLKKEKESKQKQELEQKKKRDTDMATKKRQRDEEEKREKERKRRCAEETRKHQKQPTERRHASDEKDAHPKTSDNKELQKNLVEAVKSEVKPDERIDLGNKAITSNNDTVVNVRSTSFVSRAIENIPNSLDESYVMTPYKDSDDEDEEEEALRRRKKLKPSWVREEKLVTILLSDNQALDPREIFAKKRSFNISNVLPVHVPLRGFK